MGPRARTNTWERGSRQAGELEQPSRADTRQHKDGYRRRPAYTRETSTRRTKTPRKLSARHSDTLEQARTISIHLDENKQRSITTMALPNEQSQQPVLPMQPWHHHPVGRPHNLLLSPPVTGTTVTHRRQEYFGQLRLPEMDRNKTGGKRRRRPALLLIPLHPTQLTNFSLLSSSPSVCLPVCLVSFCCFAVLLVGFVSSHPVPSVLLSGVRNFIGWISTAAP